MGVSFVTVYKMAESVAQQMRNCVCKTQTATTGTRPPLVASQYTRAKCVSFVKFCQLMFIFLSREIWDVAVIIPDIPSLMMIYKNQIL